MQESSATETTASNSRDRLGSVYYLGNGPSLYESVGKLTEFYPPELEDEENSLLPLFFVGMYVIPSSFRRFSQKN